MTNSVFTSRAALLAKSRKNLAIITASGLALTGALTVGLAASSSQANTSVHPQTTSAQAKPQPSTTGHQPSTTGHQSLTARQQSGVTAPLKKPQPSHAATNAS